ncbi:hypothetical protein BV22DRAFT_877616 [Leucogyrophana mollusca]|uniref:Uncharacterized protein n=1 Tax=Leucogyrophana mollusca TaxID=85980 RepID=A0ACB8AZY2_9AGAM|nr:hypothetical protein BV22DRAFT_877616 [Leucogyrophana mollusca]
MQVTDVTKDEKRGLLFVCYQSSFDNGFYPQTTSFAGNDYFPVTLGNMERIIGAKHGLLERQSLENTALIAVGEDVSTSSFDPPRHPDVMLALLEHPVQNYGPLPSKLQPRHIRSRPSPYPRTI